MSAKSPEALARKRLRNKAWNMAHAEQERERKRDYHKTRTPEQKTKDSQRIKAWIAENKAHIREYRRAWHLNHPKKPRSELTPAEREIKRSQDAAQWRKATEVTKAKKQIRTIAYAHRRWQTRDKINPQEWYRKHLELCMLRKRRESSKRRIIQFLSANQTLSEITK